MRRPLFCIRNKILNIILWENKHKKNRFFKNSYVLVWKWKLSILLNITQICSFMLLTVLSLFWMWEISLLYHILKSSLSAKIGSGNSSEKGNRLYLKDSLLHYENYISTCGQESHKNGCLQKRCDKVDFLIIRIVGTTNMFMLNTENMMQTSRKGIFWIAIYTT